jgi:hypothetical protein
MFQCFHILDDFFITEPAPRSACLTSLCKLLCLFTELDVPIAPGKTYAPNQVTGGPTTSCVMNMNKTY